MIVSKPNLPETFRNWNKILRSQAEIFLTAPINAGSTLLIYSSYALFDNILSNPEKYGFHAQDVRKPGGAIWMDRLHPTSKMHEIIAGDIQEFLRSFPAPHVRKEDTDSSTNDVLNCFSCLNLKQIL